MAIDKEKNTQVLLTLPHELLNRIEDYQFDHRFKNRNAAILDLLNKGLQYKTEEKRS